MRQKSLTPSNPQLQTTRPLIDAAELERLKQLTKFERSIQRKGYKVIAGIDEAGRGPLAGPVVAAACIIPANRFFAGINDSKKLSHVQRRTLFQEITEDSSVVFGVGIISHEEIDQINIYQATIAAMLQAVEDLAVEPQYLLVDGLKLPHPHIPCEKIITGDQLSQSIAAASVIAKETRDRLMFEYHEKWPEYRFDLHKGYGTKVHMEALRNYGPCPIHRKTFNGVKTEELEVSLC